MVGKTLFVFAVVAMMASVWAQDVPLVPCPGCENRTATPYPETGAWYSPEQPGTGFLLEVQNGFLLGFHFGFTPAGQPDWSMFSGPLQAIESVETLWRAQLEATRFEGGACLGCDFSPLDNSSVVATIEIEFLQRNYGRYRVDGGSWTFITPLLYGSAGFRHFPDRAGYVFPDLGPSRDEPAPWVVVFRNPVPNDSADAGEPYRVITLHLYAGRFYESSTGGRGVQYDSREKSPLATPPLPLAGIECSYFDPTAELGCAFGMLDYHGQGPLGPFRIPIANLSANRFLGEDEDGYTVEGFRLDYD